MKTALITGITGQDGSYLAEFLLQLNNTYRIVGVTRRSGVELKNVTMIYNPILCDPTHVDCCTEWQTLLRTHQVDEVYHLAAQTCKVTSLKEPLDTYLNTGYWTCIILEAIKLTRPLCRVFHASSSEIFGYGSQEVPQTESSPHQALSPYAVAKLSSYHAVQYYREIHGLYVVSGILYNHESPRRDSHFVTSKITNAVAAIAMGLQTSLELGALEVCRDWSDARDFVRGFHLTLQQPLSRDYIFSSGVLHSVKEFCEAAFDVVGLEWQKYVRCNNPEWIRTHELTQIVGDPSVLRGLGWRPEYSFLEMIEHMVQTAMKDKMDLQKTETPNKSKTRQCCILNS